MNKEQLEQEIKNIFDRNCQEVLVLNKKTFFLRKPYPEIANILFKARVYHSVTLK